MNAEQVVDILVAKAKIIIPHAGLRKLGSLGPGQYEVFGQRVKLELVKRLTGSEAEAAIAQAAGNPLVELVVVTGGRRTLLTDYASGWSENSTQVPVGGSAIQALPDRDRVSFEEVFPSTRAEAMHVALMEAEAREHLAKEKLAARAAVQQSTNSSFSIGSQASLTPNTGSWSLDMSRLEESSIHSARSPSHLQSAQQQVYLQQKPLPASPVLGHRALSPVPDSPALGYRTLGTQQEGPILQSRGLSPMSGLRQGSGASITLPVPVKGGSLNLPLGAGRMARLGGSLTLPMPQQNVRAQTRADSRQRTYSPAPSPMRRAQSPDERLRSISPAPQASDDPLGSPRVVLQWQPARNAYAPQKKQQHDWLLEERDTRSQSPNPRRGAQSPLRMPSLGAPLRDGVIPNSSPTLSMNRSQTPDVRSQTPDMRQQSQPQQASPSRVQVQVQPGPSRFYSMPSSTMRRESSTLNANASPVFSVQTIQGMSSAEAVSSAFPGTSHSQGPLLSPNPPKRPVRKSVTPGPQRWEAGASPESQTSSSPMPFPVPDAPLNSARASYHAASPTSSPHQAYRTLDPGFQSPLRAFRSPEAGFSRSSSTTSPVQTQYRLRVPPHLNASRRSISSQEAPAGRQIARPEVLAAAAQLKTEESSPRGLQGQHEEPMAPPTSVTSLIPVVRSGAGSLRAKINAIHAAHRNGSASSSSTKAQATLLWDAECFSDSQLSYELIRKTPAASLTLPVREPVETRNAYAFGARGNPQYAGVSPELLNAKLLNLRAGIMNRDRSQTFTPGLSRSSSSSSTTDAAQLLDQSGEPVQAPMDEQAQTNAAVDTDQRLELPFSFWKPALEFSGELADLRKQLASGLPSGSYPQTDAASDTESQNELPWTLWQANTELRGELAQLRQKLASTAHRSETLRQRLVEAKSRSQEAMSAIQMLHAVRRVDANPGWQQSTS